MLPPFWQRIPWLAFVAALGVLLLVGIAACSPGGARVAPQSSGTSATETPATGTPTTPQETVTAAGAQAMVNGLLVAGPTCPVEHAGQPCPLQPVPNRQVLVETVQGAIVAQVTTDQHGKFTVTLAPGTYVLLVPPGPGPFPIQRKPQQVTVAAGQIVQVQVLLDSGIR